MPKGFDKMVRLNGSEKKDVMSTYTNMGPCLWLVGNSGAKMSHVSRVVIHTEVSLNGNCPKMDIYFQITYLTKHRFEILQKNKSQSDIFFRLTLMKTWHIVKQETETTP